jgi:hypothetical protein
MQDTTVHKCAKELHARGELHILAHETKLLDEQNGIFPSIV